MTEQKTVPKREPHGPGILMLFGLALAALAAYCFYDVVYPAHAATKWQENSESYKIFLNWGIMTLAVLGAVYVWVLAAVRSKKSADVPPAETHEPTAPNQRQESQ